MLEYKFLDFDDYHEIDETVRVLNRFVERGEKRWKGEEIGFNFDTKLYEAVIYKNGWRPEELIKKRLTKLDKIEKKYLID